MASPRRSPPRAQPPGHGRARLAPVHLNQWTKTRSAWLPGGLWASLASQEQIPDRAEIFVGVDVGWTHDSTAVCWAARLSDGASAWRQVLDERSPGEYVPGGRMELALVEAFIRQLASNYRLRELAYDPSYFGRSAQELERAGIETVEFMPDGGSMRQAWQATSVTKT